MYYSYNSYAQSTSYDVFPNFNKKLYIRTLLENDKYNFYVDGVSVKSVTAVEDYTVNNLNLFKSSRSSNWKSFAKIYNFKVLNSTNTILKYHFVPVPTGLQIGDFTVPSNGMFDIVNQQFYPNQGTGTFTYGKDE